MRLKLTNKKILLIPVGLLTAIYVIISIGKSSLQQASETFRNEDCQAALQNMKLQKEIKFSTQPFSLTNQVRVNKIRGYCADNENDITNSFPSYERLEDVLIGWIWQTSPRHRMFYCATPKCGSTTWKSYILEDMRLTWNQDTHVAAAAILGVKTLFEDGKKPELLEFLESYRPANRFIIVRDPWARLVSAYEDKIVDKKWKLKKLCLAEEEYTQSENGTVTFATFIDCLLKSPRNVIWNPHVNPLTSLCGLCHMDYNLIVKLEEMDEGEPYLLKKLNFTRTIYVPPRKLKHKTYTSMYRGISEDKIKQLQEIYRYDLELFGYPSTPFD